MKRRHLIKSALGALPVLAMPRILQGMLPYASVGPFLPNWNSLQQYQVPDWFRDAKFGIWAHWGPQCQPEYGDWYARSMYVEGSEDYKYHLNKYGHPSKAGFKEVIREWKAEHWDPDQLLSLYKKAGAQYFMALANHHDNFDNYNSRCQPWNSTKLGPRKDLVGGWEKAARKQGMRFGVSVHAAHAWSFFEKAQKADQSGAYAGVPYDGHLTKADGKGLWWEGLDPQELYAQHHPTSSGNEVERNFHEQWGWGNGAVVPDAAYCEKFYKRTIDLIDQYHPDIVYFDDTVLPLYPFSDAGLRIAAHYYNQDMQRNKGKLEAVITGKILDALQRKCLVWDIERGASNAIEPLPWQTCTCIGNWHYDKPLFERHGYKSAATVIHTLADVVSKNGNLLLSVPVKGDGTIDTDETAIVADIAAWMQRNSECIYGTRPWKIFGEGPAMEAAAPLAAQGFNEGKGKPFTAADIRFTTKGDALYAIALGKPANGKLLIRSLGSNSAHFKGTPGKVTLPGSQEALVTSRSEAGLLVELPAGVPEQVAYVVKVMVPSV
jgi:alpha-L-fucosidase